MTPVSLPCLLFTVTRHEKRNIPLTLFALSVMPIFRCLSLFQLRYTFDRQLIAAATTTTTIEMEAPPRDPRARGRGRGGGGAVAPAPGPPPTPRSLEERVISLENRLKVYSHAWQQVIFERNREREEMIRLLREIRAENAAILVELRSRAPLVPLQPP